MSTYWYFAPINGNDDRPRLGGRPVCIGEAVAVEGPLGMDKSWMHVRWRIIDAMYHRNCPLALCRIEMSRDVVVRRPNDVGAIVEMLEVYQTEVLMNRFTRWCALRVAGYWSMPPAMREYLETGDDRLREAALFAALPYIPAAHPPHSERSQRKAALAACNVAADSGYANLVGVAIRVAGLICDASRLADPCVSEFITTAAQEAELQRLWAEAISLNTNRQETAQ